MKDLLKVESVELVDGFLPMYHRDYNNNISKAKCLKIKGVINNINVTFFTPSVVVRTSYSRNTQFTHIDDNSWISLINDVEVSSKGICDSHYVCFNRKIESKIKEGDEINISYSIKKELKDLLIINRVKILN